MSFGCDSREWQAFGRGNVQSVSVSSLRSTADEKPSQDYVNIPDCLVVQKLKVF